MGDVEACVGVAVGLESRVAELTLRALDLIDAARSPATLAAYAHDWRDFTEFCASIDEPALPASPGTVALYVAHLDAERNLSVSTIQRRLSAVSVVHDDAGAEPPTRHPQVRRILAGLRRMNADRQPAHKRALRVGELRRMVAAAPAGLSGPRDVSVLLSGFVGGLRRSELVGIDVEHLDLRDEGYTVRIQRSKTDQEGRGRMIVLPYSADPLLCPVRAIDRWLEVSEITTGPLYRRIRRGDTLTGERLSSQSVNLIVKATAERAGLDPTDLGAHSLRSGFATTAANRGATERAIANQTGHRSMQTLHRYVQQATAFDDNAATGLGL